jgi:hypothetical protein
MKSTFFSFHIWVRTCIVFLHFFFYRDNHVCLPDYIYFKKLEERILNVFTIKKGQMKCLRRWMCLTWFKHYIRYTQMDWNITWHPINMCSFYVFIKK